jgi:predicted GNAT superfamily acetyltransferase
MITGVTIKVLTADNELKTYTYEAYGRDRANEIVAETIRLCNSQGGIVLGHDYGVAV